MMIARRAFGSALTVLAAALLLWPQAAMAQQGKLVDPPSLAELVKAKKLPAIDKRVPDDPLRVRLDGPGESIGQHGGELTQLMGRANDIRRMSAYGYTRLVCYDRKFEIVPDLLKSFEVQEGRIFTFHLRKGHKWSDGKPFTTEDFRYFWEDMALNKELYPGGPDKQLVVDGKPAKVEVIDPVTIRYSWDKPNPYFLPSLASATPLVIYRPAHYLKRFHKSHTKADRLQEQITKRNRRDWVDLHFNRDRMVRLDNPDFPSLDPWVNTTAPPSERFIFERNPYFHRVDRDGRQLPYVDRIAITIANPKLIPAKVGAGEVELQSRGLSFNNYTLLKRGEARNGYKVRLWPQSRGSQVALYPNLNVTDPGWRELVRDVRFRRALSLAVNRREINQVIFFGLGREGANTLLPESPLFDPELARKWSGFDLKAANALLDELGLKQRDSRGIRLMRDGRPLEIIVETAGEEQEHADVLELIRDTWSKAGVALFIKPQTREVLRKRVRSGATVMSVFYGFDNGIATAETEPHELAPTKDDQLQWPVWAMHFASDGKSGEPPDVAEVKQLMSNYRAWVAAETSEQRRDAWRAMLQINADQVFTIGTVNAVPQPLIVSDKLRNVPEKAIYSWDPGAHLGMFRPESFWLAGPKEGS